MSIADCSTIQPDLFGSQSSYSSDTGDFIREATEQLSYYADPYSTNIFAAGNMPSEDEMSFSFASGGGSRHSLLVVMSPDEEREREEEGEGGGQALSDNSSSSSGEQMRQRRIRRQNKIASFGENTIQMQCGGDDALTPPPVVNNGDCQLRVESLLEPPPMRDEVVTPVNINQDDCSSPEQPKRRERRHAVASYHLNPIDIQELSIALPNERRVSGEEETVTTPRQRKTYSIEARLQNPLNMQLQLEDNLGESMSYGVDDRPIPTINRPDFEFDDDTLDVCPNPPASPHLPANTGLFFGGTHKDLPGSSMSEEYNQQNQLDVIRVSSESGSGYEGKGDSEDEDEEEGVVSGTSEDVVIKSLLTKYPHLSTYPTSSLLALSCFTTAASSSRKMSDSAIIIRKDCTTNSHLRQRHRCVSDSAAPHIVLDDDKNSEIGGWSHPYCDSGYNDEKSSRCHGSSSSAYIPSPRVSLYSSDLLSQEEGLDGGSSHSYSKPHRRFTPYNMIGGSGCSGQTKEESVSSHEETGPCQMISSPSSATGTMVRPRERARRSQIKNYSQSSLGASSVGTGASSETISLTSLFEMQSPLTVEDLLSNLGFDDFSSPQLIPDRFIPKEIEHAKPSLMRTMTVTEYLNHDSPSNSHHSSYEPSIASTCYSAPLPFSHHHISHSQHHQAHSASTASLPGTCTFTSGTTEAKAEETTPILPHTNAVVGDHCVSDLPLGATAENFLAARSSSPPPPAQSSQQQPEREIRQSSSDNRFSNTNTMTVGFHRGRLETVPEETASDLSPSPRWLSPRVSIDHSVNFDIAEGKLGASLNVQKVRKRSLPTQREGYKLSVGSLVESDTGGDSIHFSVTSYDDEIAAEREKEREDTLPHLSLEDLSIHQQQHRRRRRGVYTPPPALLTWLTQQQPIHEEDVGDPDELPWPFNEQARLRKSLTEIQLAQIALGGSIDVLSSENRDIANESQFSGSSKAEAGSSISSSPPSSIPRSSPGPAEEDTQEDAVVSRITNNLFLLRRRHSRDNSTSSLQANHKTRSLSCQSDYHLLRKDLEIPPSQVTSYSNGTNGEQEGLLRTEMIEELRYTMSTSQRRLSRALALKGEQCRQLQEELGVCKRQLAAAKCEKTVNEKRLKREAKVLLQKELGDLKHRLIQERMTEVRQLQEKHSREMSELKQAKAAEVQSLSNRLMERTEASSALSTELKENKRQAEIKENKLRSQLTEEKAKVEKTAHQEKVSSLAKLQDDLSSQKAKELSSLKEKLQNEKRTAVGRVEQKMSEQVSKLQQQLQKVREQGREEMASLEREMAKQVAEERDKSEHLRESLLATKKELEEAQKSLREVDKKRQTRDRELRRSVECQQRDILTGLLEEWQRSAEVAGVKKPRSLSVGAAGVAGGGSGGGNSLSSATETALAGLRTVNEALRGQISEIKEQLEREKHTSSAAHKAKVAEMRKLRAYAQMDKQKAMREIEERLKKEYAHEITSLRTVLCNGGNPPSQGDGAHKQVHFKDSPSHQEQGGVAKQEKDSKPAKNLLSPTHSQCTLEIQTLRQDLKTQQHAMLRAKALYSEKVQEVSELQSKIKHITKEQLLLERKIQKALTA